MNNEKIETAVLASIAHNPKISIREIASEHFISQYDELKKKNKNLIFINYYILYIIITLNAEWNFANDF